LVSVERMAKNIKDLNDLGIINARIDVAKNVDNSLAQEAAGRVQ
jgi:hypothetical protein